MVHQLGQNTLHSEKGICTKPCFLCPMFNDKGVNERITLEISEEITPYVLM